MVPHPSSLFPPSARQAQEMAQVAFELNSENITIVIAAVVGLGAGLGIPIFFVQQVGTARGEPTVFT